MDTNAIEMSKQAMEKKTSEELQRIYAEHNENEWTKEDFEAISLVLKARGDSIHTPLPKPILEKIFSSEGRIGRGTYWAIFIPLIIVGWGLSVTIRIILENNSYSKGFISGLSGLLFALNVAVLWLALETSAKRWHDLDKSGWMNLTLLIPLVNLLFFLHLGITPGTAEPNKYGKAPGKEDQR